MTSRVSLDSTMCLSPLRATPSGIFIPDGVEIPGVKLADPREHAAEKKEAPMPYPAPRRTRKMSPAERIQWKEALMPVRVQCYELMRKAQLSIAEKSRRRSGR